MGQPRPLLGGNGAGQLQRLALWWTMGEAWPQSFSILEPLDAVVCSSPELQHQYASPVHTVFWVQLVSSSARAVACVGGGAGQHMLLHASKLLLTGWQGALKGGVRLTALCRSAGASPGTQHQHTCSAWERLGQDALR